MIKKIIKLIFTIILLFSLNKASLGQARFGLYVQNHYNNSFKSYRTSIPNVGVYGYGLGVRYYLSDLDNELQFSIGLEYNRTGSNAKRTIEDSYVESELLSIWGPAPYVYKEKVYYGYWSLSYEVSYFFPKLWYLGASMSLDYPRSEKEIQTFESERHESTYENEGTYSHRQAASIGGGVFFGKRIRVKGRLLFDLALHFKTYTLWAYKREEYYLPHYEYQYPYFVGLRTGILF